MTNEVTKQIAKAIAPLTYMQKIYVESIVKGMSKVASATAAGSPNPKKNYVKLDKSATVQRALQEIREVTAGEIMFSVTEAHDLLMQAFHAATTSAEMTQAANALIKLHGTAKPEEKVIHQHHSGSVKHRGSVDELTDEQLMRLADVSKNEQPIIEGSVVEVVPTVDNNPVVMAEHTLLEDKSNG